LASFGLPSSEAEQSVIFPSLTGQPLYEFQCLGERCPRDRRLCLTPSLPNLFVASLSLTEDKATALAHDVAEAIREEWLNIASKCWRELADDPLKLVKPANEARFKRQISRFLSVTWQVTPSAHDYAAATLLNGRTFEAVRQTREFSGWAVGGWETGAHCNKDSLTGREEAICGGQQWWNEKIARLHERDPRGYWPTVFRQRQAGEVPLRMGGTVCLPALIV
jgi:hypothetical protein